MHACTSTYIRNGDDDDNDEISSFFFCNKWCVNGLKLYLRRGFHLLYMPPPLRNDRLVWCIWYILTPHSRSLAHKHTLSHSLRSPSLNKTYFVFFIPTRIDLLLLSAQQTVCFSQFIIKLKILNATKQSFLQSLQQRRQQLMDKN